MGNNFSINLRDVTRVTNDLDDKFTIKEQKSHRPLRICGMIETESGTLLFLALRDRVHSISTKDVLMTLPC